MSNWEDILVLQNEVCYYGNQRAAVLMSCKNAEEFVIVYDPIHLDYIVDLTE